MSVRLFLMGPPKVDFGGASLTVPFERRTQLLVFLALKRAWVGRAELVPMFWPELDNKLAYANLRKTLHRLQSLPWAGAIEMQGNALRFEADTDVFDFESALREQRAADALPLRRGELLSGFEDDASEAWSSWLGFERDRLRVAWRSAALDRLGADVQPGEAMDLSARLLDADPPDEAALRAHMSWLAKGGQGARARQVYQEFAARLEQDLGISPGTELKALHDSLGSTVVRVAQQQAEPAATTDRGFVGRAVELRRIAELLAQDDCRLLSVIGPGGMGKTRLVQRAMQELVPQFTHGAALVPLEDVAQPGEIAGRLAREIDLSLAGNADSLEQVIAFLRERHMLLAFDNFEQLIAGAATLETLLRSCPRLKIIVTSRVRLALAQEWLLPIEGLPCPEVEDEDHFEAFDAVRLFVKAAQRVEPALIPSTEAAAIVEICRQVEGLPLALELAAAWTRVLSCEAIAAELRRGTELLRADDAARPARHTSIEAVFEQSWRMLSATEREALARLSVFRGGFTAEAARAVAKASLPVLGALADKSLLRKEADRLQWHPLVLQLAVARLKEGAAQRDAQAAHAAYFLNLLAQLHAGSEAGDPKVLRQIDADFDNCSVAWDFSVAAEDADALRRSAPTLVNYCEHRARFHEAHALFRRAVDSPLAVGNPGLQALMLSQAALFEYRLARYTTAADSATRALEGARAPYKRPTKFRALSVLASCAISTGRIDDARGHFKQALAVAQAEAMAHDVAKTLENLALVEKRAGRYDESMRLSLESLAQHRRNGDTARMALCLSNLGSLYLFLHDDRSAAAHLQEALVLSERAGLVSTRGFVLANLTELAFKAQNVAAAQSYAERALQLAEATGLRALAAWLKTQLARLAMRRDALDAARRLLAEAGAGAVALDAPYLKAAALLAFAELLEAQGDSAPARRVLAFAMAQPAISAPDREELRQAWSQRVATAAPEAAWPSMTLDELMHRIVVEADVSHQPLVATLNGPN